MPLVELRTTRVAAGGDAVAREESGRVVFVEGALPGETVTVELTEEKPRFARGRVSEVVAASPDRVAPPCGHVARGCGGCAWMHVEPAAQRRLKLEIVRDALERIGRVTEPRLELGAALPTLGYRTTVRLGVVGARPAFRRGGSHELVDVDSCAVAHPLLNDLLRTVDVTGATEVTLRCGARTGERLVVADVPLTLPDDVRTDHVHEVVAGRRFRISAPSFFQARPDGAEALVDAVTAAIADAPPGPLVDLYGGVGLFAATVAGDRATTLVEWSSAAVADAKVNVPDATVLRLDVARWRPAPASVVVADPARTGLDKRGVAAVAGTGAGVVALVSCDPASLGRDARLLADAGYRHDGTTLVDLFPHTPHVEAVTRFIRSPQRRRTTD